MRLKITKVGGGCSTAGGFSLLKVALTQTHSQKYLVCSDTQPTLFLLCLHMIKALKPLSFRVFLDLSSLLAPPNLETASVRAHRR